MIVSPSTEAYNMGGGVCQFARQNTDGTYQGFRHLGNASDFSLSLDLTKLEHFSSLGGLKTLDMEKVTAVTRGFTLTLEEITASNMAMVMMTTMAADVQAIGYANVVAIPKSLKSAFFDLGKRNVGNWNVAYDGGTVIFVVGETLSATGMTGIVTKVVGNATSGVISLSTLTGTKAIANDAVITGGGTGAAVANGPLAFDTTDVSLYLTSTPATTYVKTTDFTVDSASGMVFITAGSGIADDTAISAAFSCSANTGASGFIDSSTSLTGKFRFVSANANTAGEKYILDLFRVSLTPDGDFKQIDMENVKSLNIKGANLGDTVNYTAPNHYGKITMVSAA